MPHDWKRSGRVSKDGRISSSTVFHGLIANIVI